MELVFSRVCECGICGIGELTTHTLLPDGWIITWEYTTTICDNCLDKWVERWGESPAHWLKGGEKELILL